MPKFLSRLSATLYKTLKRRGVPVPREQYQRARLKSAAKGEWGEVKVALVEEIQSAKGPAQNTLFTRKLLERVEALEGQGTEQPIVTALFGDGSALREAVPHVAGETLNGDLPIADWTAGNTDSQQQAFELGMAQRVLFLMGAPGSGKTRVTTQLIKGCLEKNERTLLCCHTRDAVDHTVGQLDDDTKSDSLLQARTIAATVMDDDVEPYDNVIIDDAGMVSLANVLYLASLITKRILLIGDPMQLPPVSSSETDNPWIEHNIFQHQSGTDNLSELFTWQEQNPDISVLLREQFEIPERIFNILNQLCYGSRLTSRTTTRGIISLMDTSTLDPELTGTPRSPINADHGDIVVRTLKELLQKQSLTAGDIGVLSPFRAQSQYLERVSKLSGLPEGIEFGTVHTFQGRMKVCILLDLTVSNVGHSFQILSGGNLVANLMNTAMSRCRTRDGQEGRLVVVANYQHVQKHYANKPLANFLDRIRSTTDTLVEVPTLGGEEPTDAWDTMRYGQTTDILVSEFQTEYDQLSNQLVGDDLPDEEQVRGLIWKACDLMPRLISLCNRLRAPGEPEHFRTTSGTRRRIERLSLAALELADFAPEKRNLETNETPFMSVILDLYVLIYESSMLEGQDTGRRHPDEPVYDPKAHTEESYGRIRLWLNYLRNVYAHDTTEWPRFDQERIDRFFEKTIGKPKPENILDYLRAELFLFKEVLSYLDTVRNKLRQG